MAKNDHSTTSATGDSHPLVPTGAYDHDPHGGNALQTTQPYASPNFTRTPAVVTGGMDASGLLHSLRRRWLLVTFMGLLLAAGVGSALFFLFPESDTAVARFLVSSQPEIRVYDDINTSGDSRDYKTYQATQVAMVRSPAVLALALQDTNLQNVAVLKAEENPQMWLDENLDIRFEGQSELLRIALTLDEPQEDLRAIVQAVCNAYYDEVVMKNRFERSKTLDSLKATYAEYQVQLREKWDEYRQISQELGIAEGQFDPSVRMLFDELTNKMKEQAKLEEQMRYLQMEFARWKSTKDNPDLKDQQINEMVSGDMEIMTMDQEGQYIKAELREAEKRSAGRKTREIQRIQEKLDLHNQQVNARKAELAQEIKSQIANSPDIELAIVTEEMQRQLNFAAGRLQQVLEGRDIEKPDGTVEHEKGIYELRAELEKKAAGSTELTIRMAELDQLEAIAADLAQRIQQWEIELDAPSRIQLVDKPYVMPGINKLQRYAITAIGSVATLLVACLGIAYMEFLGRRLNGPSQLDEGLGIRVVGTLPPLNARRMMNPKHPLVAQLTESIDSVRTALMHDSTSKARQVVLVTSPASKEGRTTVASQLAASLARAGRRTLLIDGDLRHPALHLLFDVPLEDGLCEVLRAEADVTDVVRPTHAEGLWLMTAGYCDADAVHAMATDQIQPIFEKLRSEYDFVIIDGAPVLGLSDSLMMGQHCDGALLSVLRDQTSVPSIYKASELLRDVGVRLIGSVVNGVTAKADRRVTHLQVASPKAARKQLEAQTKGASTATATKPAVDELDDLDDLDFSDLSDDKN